MLNDVVLNQVLVRFDDPGVDHDSLTEEVIRRVQEDGTCWLGGTTWRKMRAMRISVCNWNTTSEDVDRSTAAILKAHRDALQTQADLLRSRKGKTPADPTAPSVNSSPA